jgi:hypothetical protein
MSPCECKVKKRRNKKPKQKRKQVVRPTSIISTTNYIPQPNYVPQDNNETLYEYILRNMRIKQLDPVVKKLPKTFRNASVGEDVPLPSLVDVALQTKNVSTSETQTILPARYYDDNTNDIADIPFMNNVANEYDESDWIEQLIKKGKTRRSEKLQNEVDKEYADFLKQKEEEERYKVKIPASLSALTGREEIKPEEKFKKAIATANMIPFEEKSIFEEQTTEQPIEQTTEQPIELPIERPVEQPTEFRGFTEGSEDFITPGKKSKKEILSEIMSLLDGAYTPKEKRDVIKTYTNRKKIDKTLSGFNKKELEDFMSYLLNA